MEAVDQLSVRIALLASLVRVPCLPENKSLDDFVSRCQVQPERSILLHHEAIFVEQFAYICAHSDDPLHVLAVCIEEHRRPEGVLIRLAANTGQHQSLFDGLVAVTELLQIESKSSARVTRSH